MSNDINLTIEGGIEGGITVEKDGTVFSNIGRLEFNDPDDVDVTASETSDGVVSLDISRPGGNTFQFLQLAAATGNIEFVGQESDLPDASSGTRTLENNTVYFLTGFITTADTIELAETSPIVGAHGGTSGIIYTGGANMIEGTNAHFFARDVLFSAPGGTVFDINSGTSYEILAESISVADPAGMGNISNLGTINGYRVPSFKGCNFEDFDAGLTLSGTSDKVFFSETPFREVDTSGVTILQFDSTFETDIIDITDCYVKNVQSDTEVVNVDSNATINDIFQYRGTTHDATVTQSNILTGAASLTAVGYDVSGSYPLRDSDVSVSMYSTSSTPEEVTGSGTAETQITVPTDTSNEERITQSSDGIVQYTGKRNTNTRITYSVAASGANTSFRLSLYKNGSPIQPDERAVTDETIPNSSTPVEANVTENVEINNGDTLSAAIENTGGTADLDVQDVTLVI